MGTVSATVGGEAVLGLHPAELRGAGRRTLQIAEGVLKADNDNF